MSSAATTYPASGSHSLVVTIILVAIIVIGTIVRIQRGRSSPNSLYTPTTGDPETGQDPMASGFPDQFGAVAYNPTLAPAPAAAPALPAFTYGLGTPSAGVVEPSAPPPPTVVPGLPQFATPQPPAAVPGAVPSAFPAVVPGAVPGPAVPAPAGLPAAGTFPSQGARVQYGLISFIAAAALAYVTAISVMRGIDTGELAPGILGFAAAVLAAVALGVRGVRIGVSYDAEGLIARGIFRTKRWEWSRLDKVQIEVAQINTQQRNSMFRPNNTLRKMMRVVEIDGEFSVLRTMMATVGGGVWLDDAACQLNAQIQARRHG